MKIIIIDNINNNRMSESKKSSPLDLGFNRSLKGFQAYNLNTVKEYKIPMKTLYRKFIPKLETIVESPNEIDDDKYNSSFFEYYTPKIISDTKKGYMFNKRTQKYILSIEINREMNNFSTMDENGKTQQIPMKTNYLRINKSKTIKENYNFDDTRHKLNYLFVDSNYPNSDDIIYYQ
jgi:hypothetical protein